MSNEEAVKMLRTMQRTVYLGNRKFEDAIKCAIKALSEPLQPWEILAAQAVLSQPAEPKRGKWIRTGSGSLYDHYECSECGKAPKWDCMGDNRWRIAFTDFCPNCGAKMRGQDD